MIGVKTLVVIVAAATTTTFTLVDGRLGLVRVEHLSVAAAFAIGLFASASAALVGVAWRPELPSRAALALTDGKPRWVTELVQTTRIVDIRKIPRSGDPAALIALPDLLAPKVRVWELPAFFQRALFVVAFAAIGLATFDNTATARIASVPANLVEPSHAEYCGIEVEKREEPAPAPVIEQPVDQAGCALVKRAVELGYKKDLGNCAPKVVKQESPAIKREKEACTKRQLDEPFSHFMYRRIVETSNDSSPLATASTYVDDFETRTRYTGDFLGDIRNSVTGAPHASHHIWVNLPDPHPASWLDWFTGHAPCTSRFMNLELWPRWPASAPPGAVFEHVLGQLLFASRFGTPASCSDYTIHWGAPADACAKLAANPLSFLADTGALESIRGVLDRRARQLALRALAKQLGHPPTLPEPPPARFIASAACFIVGAPAQTTGREVTLYGEPIALREVRVPALQPAGAGAIDLYIELARMLGGTPYAGPAVSPRDRTSHELPGKLDDTTFPLLALEPLADADPFVGERAGLADPEVSDVYPIEQHLFAFIDAFRRAYLPQRGRL